MTSTGTMTTVTVPAPRPAPRPVDPLDVPEYLEDGYARVPDVVPPHAVRAVLRLLGQDLRRHTIPAESIPDLDRTTWFPHLRNSPEVLALQSFLYLPGHRDWATPQLCVRLPDFDPDPDSPLNFVPHQDRTDDGRTYPTIAGVVLTDHSLSDGALAVWPHSHLTPEPPGPLEGPVLVPALAGDVIFMHPNLYHCGTLNFGAYPRVVVYFRAEPHVKFG